MAFKIPNQADAFNGLQAAPDSVDFDIIALASSGVGVLTGCTVTAQGTPDMTVAVAGGTNKNAGSVTVAAGNVTITAAHATLNRFDLIVANASGVKSAVAGTAAASPVFPAIPASSVVFASVLVPAAATTILATYITDKRVLISNTFWDVTLNGTVTGLSTITDATIANPTITGGSINAVTTVPTASPGTNSTILANTAFVTAAVAAGGSATVEILTIDFTSYGNTAATTEQDAWSWTMPANKLDVNGDTVRFRAAFKCAGGGDNKTFKVYFGGTLIGSIGPAANDSSPALIEGTLTRLTSGTQRITTMCTMHNGGGTNVQEYDLTKDLTASQIWKTTVQSGVATISIATYRSAHLEKLSA